MRTFEAWTNSGSRLEGVVFSDGSVTVRRLNTDPCERITFTFEGISECEAELDIKAPEPETAEGHYTPIDNDPRRCEAAASAGKALSSRRAASREGEEAPGLLEHANGAAGEEAEAVTETNPNESLDSDLEEMRDRAYIEGQRAAWRSQLRNALAELLACGDDDAETKLAALVLERDEIRSKLREVCEDFGDNEWSDDLHLGDVIEKHLVPYLEEL